MRACLAWVLLLGCAGDGPFPSQDDTGLAGSGVTTTSSSAAPAGAVTWDGAVGALFQTRCVTCHAGELPAGEFDLATAPLEAMLEVPSVQADMLRVSTGDHLYSYVWHKVNGSQSIAGGNGTNMPLGAWLDDSDINMIAEWIDRGCP